ncbi:chaperonin [Culex quinquefasciatus]|uniref:Chaperonin n=1 Tax=Culex quinquefasciatus TaxID=7176 RepID=B0WJJ8_CULQU|nr:chaperonin [Culex quinquefasciatus]|eukprot:XP_001848882.1 chaperonin [Culex quinquefasciatus]
MLTQNNRTEIAKAEKIPGGSIEESCVLHRFMLNRDVHRRYIEKSATFCSIVRWSLRMAKVNPTWALSANGTFYYNAFGRI